jgi:hypothetical protein
MARSAYTGVTPLEGCHEQSHSVMAAQQVDDHEDRLEQLRRQGLGLVQDHHGVYQEVQLAAAGAHGEQGL